MRKIVLQMTVSLDGYIAGPDGELDWHLVDEELHRHFNDRLGAMSALLHGRVMYELMADYWPTADQDPDAPEWMAQFARIWREMPKLVYSRTLRQVGWNSTLVREVVPQEVHELKQQPGGDMVVGGMDLAAEFQRHGLVDEYRLYVAPLIIGGGKPLFRPGTPRTSLRLVESHTFGNGVQLLRYQCTQ